MTMKDIRQSVGYNSINNYQDVLIVQTLLQQQEVKDLRIDGLFGPNTLKVIKEFQARFLRIPDGVVSPGKKTIQLLNVSPGTVPTSSQPQQLPFKQEKSRSARDKTRGAVYPQIVTIDMLDIVNTTGKSGKNQEILPYINRYLRIFEISDQREIAQFLAQAAAESKFYPGEENLNYGLKGARGTWGNKYGDLSTVCTRKKDIRHKRTKQIIGVELRCDPVKLANMVYGIKHTDLGNTEIGDGFKYRGRGILQLTGRYNYNGFMEFHNDHDKSDQQDFIKNPDLLSTSYKYGIESALYFWKHTKGLREAAQTGNKKN